VRIDKYLLEKGHVKTRAQATDLIKRGLVYVNEKQVIKPGLDVSDDVQMTIKEPLVYVGRGGLKLKDAIDSFGIDFDQKIVIDIGASTGGFTDCALQHGAKLVYTYDVGKDQLDPSLKSHPKVIFHEGINILDVNLVTADLIMIDVSFTSIKPILSHIASHDALIIALIKPQFEVGPVHMKKGVLKDTKMHKSIVNDIISYANHLSFHVVGFKASALKGKSGNQEYLMILKKKPGIYTNIDQIGDL
jgi:23S rRNA (cytidine1920-2'-O)/16S rRNA (cytidine1409-2'-O)-methyltransferase